MAYAEEPPAAPAAGTEDLKCFVGGIPFHYGSAELKQGESIRSAKSATGLVIDSMFVPFSL
jgi:hypothetical protein